MSFIVYDENNAELAQAEALHRAKTHAEHWSNQLEGEITVFDTEHGKTVATYNDGEDYSPEAIILDNILYTAKHDERREQTRQEWLAHPPFSDDPHSRAKLREQIARRIANSIGKLQAIDEYTAKESADLAEASQGYSCKACGRPEHNCSTNPCLAVTKDRGEA